MAKTIVKIEGLRELDAALGELPKTTAKAVLRKVGLKALQPVADDARALAPDDPETGGNDLRSSIAVSTKLSPRQARLARSAVKKGEADKSFVEVYAGAGPLPYAHLQEFGTVNHAAQAFMRPAWDQNKMKVLESVKDGLWGEIEKAAKRLAKKQARMAAKV